VRISLPSPVMLSRSSVQFSRSVCPRHRLAALDQAFRPHRHDQGQDQIVQKPSPVGKRHQNERDAHHRGVDAEVVAQPPQTPKKTFSVLLR